MNISSATVLAAAPGGTTITFVAFLAGLCAFAAAVTWRFVRLMRVRRGVGAGLRADDPAVRAAAVSQAAELGLASTAPALLRAVRSENEPEVLAALVRTVAARQWEPASTSGIVELRLWARAYADRHPEVRRNGTSGPMLPGVAGVVPPPSLNPSRMEDFRTRPDWVPAADHDRLPDEPAAEASPHLPFDQDRMGPVRVLVTGVGGPAGVAVVRALQARGHYVVGVDADGTAAGLRLADEGHLIPAWEDPHYLAALLRVATVTDAQALIATVAEEYRALSGASDYLVEAGLRALVPDPGALETCIDKWAFFEAMSADGLPVPPTNLASAENVPGPWIIKPRFGRGSRDVVTATSRRRLASALRTVPEPIVQTQLVGREFTCDALVDGSGAVAGLVSRWRDETRGGISTKGTTFDDEAVADVVTLALKTVGLRGPANVQGFVSPDGAVTVHEINPRFSGGLPLSLAAGADLVEEYLRDIMGLPVRPERLVGRPGVTMTRYFCEIFQG